MIASRRPPIHDLVDRLARRPTRAEKVRRDWRAPAGRASAPVACMVAYANYFTDARIKNYVDALLRAGYQVDVFALGEPAATRPGLRVSCLMPKVWSGSVLPYLVSQLWFLALAAFRIALAYPTRRYRVVHVHNIPDFIVFAAVVPKLFGARVILDIHDTMPESYATKFRLPLGHPLIAAIRLEERVSASFADRVITTNDLHKEALVEHGIAARKIGVVMNLGNERIFRPRPRERATGGLTLAYHGTVAERLGIDVILRAIHLALPNCPKLRFLLIGDGDSMPTVRRLISDYGLDPVVEVRGWVPVECLPEALSVADVGVVGNRRYTELLRNWMLPVKMLEYAAMEIPTIAPRLRVIEHYFDETNALLYEPDDYEDLARRIQEAYGDAALRGRLHQGLRDFNARWNWASTERQYLDLVSELTGAQRR